MQLTRFDAAFEREITKPTLDRVKYLKSISPIESRPGRGEIRKPSLTVNRVEVKR